MEQLNLIQNDLQRITQFLELLKQFNNNVDDLNTQIRVMNNKRNAIIKQVESIQ